MEIRIYTADVGELEDIALYDAIYKKVSAYRQEKCCFYRFQKDRRLSLGAGALLENALGELGVDDLTVAVSEYGKPQLVCTDRIRFNLSHSGSKVMCVVSDHDIGCDVERVTDFEDKLARKVLTDDEYRKLTGISDKALRNEMFFRYWTLKESFMKATGLGFMMPPESFCVVTDSPEITVLQDRCAGDYFFFEHDKADGYKYSVCSRDKKITSPVICHTRFCEILSQPWSASS